MSEGPQQAAQQPNATPRGRSQRSAKNYLLDRHFQLKYTGLLVGIALLLSAALGAILWVTSNKVIEQSHESVKQGQATVRQGQETVKRGQQVIESSRNLSRTVAMNIDTAKNPELAKIFEEDAAEDDRRLKEEQTRLERDALDLQKWSAELEQRAKHIEDQQRAIRTGLIIILSLLVICVGLAGIVFTHKVAGPIFKMKRLLRQVGEGKLVVHERLRRGDELHDFFEAFEKTVEDLRQRKAREIASIDAVLKRLDAGPAAPEGVEMLRKLRAEMQEHIEG